MRPLSEDENEVFKDIFKALQDANRHLNTTEICNYYPNKKHSKSEVLHYKDRPEFSVGIRDAIHLEIKQVFHCAGLSRTLPRHCKSSSCTRDLWCCPSS